MTTEHVEREKKTQNQERTHVHVYTHMQEPLGSHLYTCTHSYVLVCLFLSLISPPRRPGSELMHGFSEFACGLNELEEGVAPTDSRLRPDQRIMEQGDFDTANNEKVNPTHLASVCHVYMLGTNLKPSPF